MRYGVLSNLPGIFDAGHKYNIELEVILSARVEDPIKY